MDKGFRLIIVVFLAMAVVTTSGCEPLRKKFTRKKKATTTDTSAGVVFDPVDYPELVKSSAETYAHHYGLAKAWIGDLQTSVEENANEKKIRHTISMIEEQLSAMRSLLSPEIQSEADICLADVEKLSAEFAKPEGLRNKTVVLSQVRTLERRVRDIKSHDRLDR